jgi:hypothetical protein
LRVIARKHARLRISLFNGPVIRLQHHLRGTAAGAEKSRLGQFEQCRVPL